MPLPPFCQDPEESALRRLALQIAIQLPVERDEAMRVINALRDIVLWRNGAASGREERTLRLKLVGEMRPKDIAS